jgi:hypothetical protein
MGMQLHHVPRVAGANLVEWKVAEMTVKELKRLEARVNKLQEEYRVKLRVFQRECKHPNVLECAYTEMHYGNCLPPRRVCKDCGLAEDGWGCGFQKLRQPDEYRTSLRERIPLVSRDRVQFYTRYAE